jgi:hypothetical protein
MVRPRDVTRGPGGGVDRCRDFLVADRRRRQDREHARFSHGSLGRGHGVRDRWLDGLLFRREERLGRLARARDPLTVITVRGLLLLPVIEQGSSGLFGCSRYRSGFVNFGRSLPQMLDATSTSKSTKAHEVSSGKIAPFQRGHRIEDARRPPSNLSQLRQVRTQDHRSFGKDASGPTIRISPSTGVVKLNPTAA